MSDQISRLKADILRGKAEIRLISLRAEMITLGATRTVCISSRQDTKCSSRFRASATDQKAAYISIKGLSTVAIPESRVFDQGYSTVDTSELRCETETRCSMSRSACTRCVRAQARAWLACWDPSIPTQMRRSSLTPWTFIKPLDFLGRPAVHIAQVCVIWCICTGKPQYPQSLYTCEWECSKGSDGCNGNRV